MVENPKARKRNDGKMFYGRTVNCPYCPFFAKHPWHVNTHIKKIHPEQFELRYHKTKKQKQEAQERRKKRAEQRKKKRKKKEKMYIAQLKVKKARRDNILQKEPCMVCGSEEYIHAHHEDYDKPLDVIWLCAKHHSQIHHNNINLKDYL